MNNTSNKKSRLLLLLIILALVAISINKAGAQTGRHFMWEVSSGKGKVYLLGSIHMAKKELYPLPGVIEKAYESSSAIAVELNINEVNPQQVLKYALYQDTQSLKGNVSPETYAKLKAMFAKYNIPETAFNKFKPWFAVMSAVSLELMTSEYKQEYGIDVHFLNKAKESKKKILELETFEEQINIFDKDLAFYQDSLLEYSLNDFDNSKTQVDSMFIAWKNGDAAMMQRITMDEMQKDPRYRTVSDILIDKRNVRMTEKIEKWLDSGETTFVIVGSGHLIGENGIVNLLKNTGRYKVEQK